MPASRPSSPSGAENFRNSASSVWATGRCKTRAVHDTIPPVFSCIEDHDGVCDPPFTSLQAGAAPHLRMLSRIGIRLPLLFFADVRHHLFHATIMCRRYVKRYRHDVGGKPSSTVAADQH